MKKEMIIEKENEEEMSIIISKDDNIIKDKRNRKVINK